PRDQVPLCSCAQRPGRHHALGSFPTRRSSDLPAARALTKMATKGAPCQCLYPAIPIRIVDISEQDVHPRPVRSAIGGKTVPLPRSEEHTSELQSREKLVCRLLLQKQNHAPSKP